MTNDAEKILANLHATCKSPRAERSLRSIEKAVNIVLQGRWKRSLSSVAKICEDQFGGPKYQSICNNYNYRSYIKARFSEARSDSLDSRSDALPEVEAEALIGILRARIRGLSEENARIKRAFRTLAPIPLDRILDESYVTEGSDAGHRTEVDVIRITTSEKRDIQNFLKQAYDLGFDIAADGRLTSSEGLTVIGVEGMNAIQRLVNPLEKQGEKTK